MFLAIFFDVYKKIFIRNRHKIVSCVIATLDLPDRFLLFEFLIIYAHFYQDGNKCVDILHEALCAF